MKKAIITALTFILSARAFGQDNVQLNYPAPDIRPDAWIGESQFSSDHFDGKVVVIDFWFTRCAPCIYTIPHLNELADKYRDRGVEFVAISFESSETVSRFLSRRTIHAKIGIDSTEHLTQKFDVKSYPTTYLIDRKGRVVWSGYPGKITEGMLDYLIGDRYQADVTEDESVTYNTGELRGEIAYNIEVGINDDQKSGSGFQYDQSQVNIVNKSVVEIAQLLLGLSGSRISAALGQYQNYDVQFSLESASKGIDIKATTFEAILDELNISSSWEDKEVEVFEVSLEDPLLLVENALDTATSTGGMSRAVFEDYVLLKNAHITHLINELESMSDTILIDDTELNGFFEFKIPRGNLLQIREFLRLQYGLALNPAYRRVRILSLQER
ncbi:MULTISPECIES: TlpA disulfide reductase family protein [unclassified Imperialibacter]|uniref:TlpA family protein disulfide reductase n=1 Tax=unclassified Imperialibacter TaxID=2629706 RepID=UPI00186A34D1|nr:MULTISPECIES: TlpA disulfide reductase family protein [unclassified Imperialibacter]CAD5297180.1 conserved exported hypothetical protein [Imperialibacter sp. 89]